MPTYEYRCEPCEVEFEETLLQQEDVKKYSQQHPCPNCHEMAPRLGISVTNFKFAGGVRRESGVHGQSGSHDLDYPTLDKAVGRSSEKKWQRITREQAERNKIRKETGVNAISKDKDGKFIPSSKDNLKVREMALTTLKKVRGD